MIIDIGQACFANDELTVISYKGAMYYRSCDARVSNLVGGGASFCVKRIGHPGEVHEDYSGMTWYPLRKGHHISRMERLTARVGVITALTVVVFAIFLGLLGDGGS